MTEQEQILTHILDCRRVDLYTDAKPLTPRQTGWLKHIEERRRSGEPLQYILGDCEFMGLTLSVEPRVFIPRPETEILVEVALEKMSQVSAPLEILDLGTGSGNIAVGLARYRENCVVTAVDSSGEALWVARENARRHKVADQITFLQGDLFEPLGQAEAKKFDVIVSNPPYIPGHQLAQLPREIHDEPVVALNGGEDGLDFYRRIFIECRAFINSGGLLILEIGDDQRLALEDIVSQHPFLKWVECHRDLCGRERVVVVRQKINLILSREERVASRE